MTALKSVDLPAGRREQSSQLHEHDLKEFRL